MKEGQVDNSGQLQPRRENRWENRGKVSSGLYETNKALVKSHFHSKRSEKKLVNDSRRTVTR